jgi:PKD repeat protein
MKYLYTFIAIFGFLFSNLANAQDQNRESRMKNHMLFQQANKAPAAILTNQLYIDTTISLQAALQALVGPGVIVSNITYTGAPMAIGAFVDSSSTLGVTNGIIITSGKANLAIGPNNSSSAGYSNMTPGDADMTLIANSPTYDAASIEFDFTPLTDTIVGCNFVFGSDEYPEFVGSFNDVFAFLASGPGIAGPYSNNAENLALVPGTSTPIGINTVNNGNANTGPCMNCAYYISNMNGTILQYDGYLQPIALERPVLNGMTYHFKIALADAGDPIFDSGVFLEAGSFLGKASLPAVGFSFQPFGDSIAFENTTNYATKYVWDFGDGTMDSINQNPGHKYNSTGTFNVTLHAYNYYQHATISQAISITSAGICQELQPADDIKILNAGNGVMSVRITGSKFSMINLYSIAGNLVQSYTLHAGQTEQVLNLQDLPKGIYSLQAISGNKVVNKKVLR